MGKIKNSKEDGKMASRKTKKAAEAEETEQAVKSTTEEVKADSGANDEATEVKEEEGQQGNEMTLVYIGPSLPAGQLKCNKIMIGTPEEIKKELETVLEKYPLVEKMLVPVEKLAEKKDKVKTAGNILNKYYTDILSAIAANERKEE